MAVDEYYVNKDTGLTKISLDVLVKLVNLKVDAVKATDPTTALVIFVYDSEYKHNIFQLCVYREQKDARGLIWRPFIDNSLGPIFRFEHELKDFLGSYLLIEMSDNNLQDSLMQLVAEQKLTEKELEIINNGGKEQKEDPKAMQAYVQEECANDPTLTALPTVLDGLGMPHSNPYLDQYNKAKLAGKDAPPILTDEQLAERIACGAIKKTKSGIYLAQN